MLLLARKIGQSVTLEVDGKTTIITLLSINGNQVRLGFSGSPEVKILRNELHKKGSSNGRKRHS